MLGEEDKEKKDGPIIAGKWRFGRPIGELQGSSPNFMVQDSAEWYPKQIVVVSLFWGTIHSERVQKVK